MATMKRCLAQLSLNGRWGTEHLWPELEVDLDRVLAPAIPAVVEKGEPGADGYVAGRPAVPAVTVREAIAGREDCFEDLNITIDAGAAPDGFKHVVVPAETDFSNATITAIEPAAPSPLNNQE